MLLRRFTLCHSGARTFMQIRLCMHIQRLSSVASRGIRVKGLELKDQGKDKRSIASARVATHSVVVTKGFSFSVPQVVTGELKTKNNWRFCVCFASMYCVQRCCWHGDKSTTCHAGHQAESTFS